MKRNDSMLTRVEDYFRYRRALGYALRIEGAMLLNFARFGDKEGHRGPLTCDLAIRWARLPSKADRLYWARRIEVLIGFARYCKIFDPQTEIPPRQLFGPAHRRKTPYIYSCRQLEELLSAARQLPRDGQLQTYYTLFGLLACTGLRISEALAVAIAFPTRPCASHFESSRCGLAGSKTANGLASTTYGIRLPAVCFLNGALARPHKKTASTGCRTISVTSGCPRPIGIFQPLQNSLPPQRSDSNLRPENPLLDEYAGIPLKRFARPLLDFLSQGEMQAILQAMDDSWSGRRDHLLFLFLYNTGARVSEALSVRVQDVQRDDYRAVQLLGKGRKQRTVPLWKETAHHIRAWLKLAGLKPDQPLLPNRFGRTMTRTAVQQRLQLHVRIAQLNCPSLRRRRISPHTIRKATAMSLLQSGVAASVIALWLGHEDPTTTHQYIEADLLMKEQALRRLQPPKERHTRFKPRADLLTFLDSL